MTKSNPQELADFLKTKREKLTPDLVGLPTSKRRRTPGLRREEVAQMAGISVTWYTWLEQGRPIHVSVQVLESLANALRLERHEKQYLFALASDSAGIAMPEAAAAEPISPTLQHLLDHQAPYPAYILGQDWQILAWNHTAGLLFGFSTLAADTLDRNMLWYTFVRAETRPLLVDWEDRAKRLIAEFRADCRVYTEEIWFKTLVEQLMANSVEFAAYWSRHEVLDRRGGRRDFDHPLVGRLVLEQVSLQVSSTPACKVIVLLPLPEHESAEKLGILAGVE